MIDSEAKRATAAWMARRLMWHSGYGNDGAMIDIVDWLANSDEHWLAGYIDADLGLPEHLYLDDDERDSYVGGRRAFEGWAGAKSNAVATAASLAGIDIAHYASHYGKACAALEVGR